MTLPASLTFERFNSLASSDPMLYEGLRRFGGSFNDLIAHLSSQDDPGIQPLGPRSVSVTMTGGTATVVFGSDSAQGVSVSYYIIARAFGGTRSAPTSPTFDSATVVGVVPAQEIACYPGVESDGYRFVDRDFTITQLDPANPARVAYWVYSVTPLLKKSIPISTTGSQTPGFSELLLNGPGDQSPENLSQGSLNLLYNTAFVNTRVFGANRQFPATLLGCTSSPTTPVVITTPTAHGLVLGDTVYVYNSTFATVNGYWSINPLSPTTFQLVGSVSPGAGSGCDVLVYDGQPAPPGRVSSVIGALGVPAWSPWADGHATLPFFVADGSVPTGEVLLPAPATGGETAVGQQVDSSRFLSAQRLCVSVYARAGGVPTNSRLTLRISGLNSGVVDERPIDASQLTSTYKRFTWQIETPGPATPRGNPLIYVGFVNQNLSGVGTPVYILRPMVNEGNEAALWTNSLQDDDVTGANNINYSPKSLIPTWAREVIQYILRDPSILYE